MTTGLGLYQVKFVQHGRFGARVARRFVVLAVSGSEAVELVAPVNTLGYSVEVEKLGEQIVEIEPSARAMGVR